MITSLIERPRTLVAVAIAALLCSAATAAPRLNVLFIAVDDLRPELGCYGQPIIKTPNIDRLAQQGTVFRRAYCQQALCAPSRASVLTGLRPDSTGIFDLTHPVSKTLPDVHTLPQHFRAAGYETISLGKIYHHLSDDNGAGWSHPAWEPPGVWNQSAEAENGPLPGNTHTTAWECADVPDTFYPDGKVAERAVTELARFKQSAQPFFLAVGIHRPHLPFFAPKRYWDLYRRDNLKLPMHQDWPVHMPREAGTDWGELRQYRGIPKTGRLTDEDARTLIHGYYASVSYADAMIGRVLDELDRQHLRDNTVVILWGDHGWKLDDYGAWCKHTNFEVDTHAPLIVALPHQRTAGRPCDALVEFVDIYPTLAELCGLATPPHCQGTSLAPLLRESTLAWKDAAFSQYPHGANVMGYTVRDARWRYTEWIELKSQRVVARELYDHAGSPIASENLADDPLRVDDVRRLATLLDHGHGWQKLQTPR